MLFTADFETTTDPLDCRVWACGICSIDETHSFKYGNSLEWFIEFAKNNTGSTFYFHNLKFDGEFILCYLFEHGYKYVTDRKKLKTKTFTTLISDKGQFYSLEICFNKNEYKTEKITIYDSLKILPLALKQ